MEAHLVQCVDSSRDGADLGFLLVLDLETAHFSVGVSLVFSPLGATELARERGVLLAGTGKAG